MFGDPDLQSNSNHFSLLILSNLLRDSCHAVIFDGRSSLVNSNIFGEVITFDLSICSLAPLHAGKCNSRLKGCFAFELDGTSHLEHFKDKTGIFADKLYVAGKCKLLAFT